MKVALFESELYAGHNYTSVGSVDLADCRDYVRISEFVEVEFPPLPKKQVIEEKLAAIDRTEQALREKFEVALSGIERQRAELMALPNLESA